MEEKGMVPIDNPSEFFMNRREEENIVPGSALSVIKKKALGLL